MEELVFRPWGVPVYLGLDYGVHPDITLGGEISFRSYHDRWSGYEYNHYHYRNFRKW